MKFWKSYFSIATCFLLAVAGCSSSTTSDPPQNSSGGLTVTPLSLDFGLDQVEIKVVLTSSSQIQWAAQSDADWIAVVPESGTFTGSMELLVKIDRSKLTTGANSAALKINGLSVTVKATASESELTFTPTRLDFGTTQTKLTFALSTASTATIPWTAYSNDGWISVAPSSGNLNKNASVAVTIDRTQLQAGLSTGEVVLNGQSIPVQATKQAAAQLQVVPATISLSSNERQYNLTLIRSGVGSVSWSTTTDKNWVHVSPSAGTLSNNSEQVSITVDDASLVTGSNSANIIFQTSTGQVITVPLAVTQEVQPITIWFKNSLLTETHLIVEGIDKGSIMPGNRVFVYFEKNPGHVACSWVSQAKDNDGNPVGGKLTASVELTKLEGQTEHTYEMTAWREVFLLKVIPQQSFGSLHFSQSAAGSTCGGTDDEAIQDVTANTSYTLGYFCSLADRISVLQTVGDVGFGVDYFLGRDYILTGPESAYTATLRPIWK